MQGENMGGLMGAGSETQVMERPGQEQLSGGNQSASGEVDIQPIIDGIEVPPNLKPMYDKIVLAGMRIMFSKGSHQLMVSQLQQEGPLAAKLSQGIVSLMYMLWSQSNKSIPPQLIIPAAVALTVRAFEYVQKSGDPEASPQVLGDAIDGTIEGVMRGFGSDSSGLEHNVEQFGRVAQEGGGSGMAPNGALPQGSSGQGSPMPQQQQAAGSGLMGA